MSVIQQKNFHPTVFTDRAKVESHKLDRDTEDRQIHELYKAAHEQIIDCIHKDLHYSYHAEDRMRERGVTQSMVREVLCTGTRKVL